MSEGTTCYERDEALCEDQMCLRVGCKIRNLRLSSSSADTKGLVDAALRHADGLSAQLAKPDWKLGRAHIEQARNSIKKLADILAAAQGSPDRDKIALILYECEKRRATSADAVIKGAFPNASDALLMEPWDECKDALLSDADAVLASLHPTQGGDKGEAVAWRTRWKTGGERDREWEMWTYRPDRPAPDENKIIEPLYAAPQPASNAYTAPDAKEALEALAEVANLYDEREDDNLAIMVDFDQPAIRALSLSHCRKARAALKGVALPSTEGK